MTTISGSESNSMTRWFNDLAAAYKAMLAIIGFITIGIGIGAYTLGHQAVANAQNIQTNTQAISTNTARLNTVNACMDTIKADLSLVRCWVRSDIEGTNPASCLVGGHP